MNKSSLESKMSKMEDEFQLSAVLRTGKTSNSRIFKVRPKFQKKLHNPYKLIEHLIRFFLTLL